MPIISHKLTCHLCSNKEVFITKEYARCMQCDYDIARRKNGKWEKIHYTKSDVTNLYYETKEGK